MAQTYRIRRKQITHYLVRSESWISDGTWAVRRENVRNRALFESDSALAAWARQAWDLRVKTDADFAKFFEGPRKAFTLTTVCDSPWRIPSHFLITEGDAALVRASVLRYFDLQPGAILYGKDGQSALSNGKTEAESTLILMPMKKDADMIAALRRWLVAPDSRAATNLRDAEHVVPTVGAPAP